MKSLTTTLKDTRALGDSHLFQKAVETPIQNYQNEFDDGENQTENPVLIDIEQEELEKNIAEENLMKLAISAANQKWHAEDEENFRNSVEHYALDFLRSMNGTLCYLTVAFRMLAKTPWTSHMVSVHIRQAAMYAISQGWYVNTQQTHGINFRRAELALAASTFLGDLTPNLPDDTDHPLFLVIQELPHSCADLFSTGTIVCKHCGCMGTVPVPTFASGHMGTSPSWRSLGHCLEKECMPFPWILNQSDRSWHDVHCSRDDVDTIDVKLGPWVYVSFRSSNVEAFPQYATIADILQDASLERYNLIIGGIICSNVHEGNNRHYWFVEVENGKIEGIYDSLHGYCPITVETSKKLRVTGIVLTRPQSSKPILKNRELELKAGKPVHRERRSDPIKVSSRNQWRRSTQQTIPARSHKVQKKPGKQRQPEQPSLGKLQGKAKAKAKAKSNGKHTWHQAPR